MEEPYGRDTGHRFHLIPTAFLGGHIDPILLAGKLSSWKVGNLPTVTWLVSGRSEIRTHLTRPPRV